MDNYITEISVPRKSTPHATLHRFHRGTPQERERWRAK
jgi:hypothetical protein